MKRYNVPRIAFINKLDTPGADPIKVTEQLRDKLALNAIMYQYPIGIDSSLEGVIDLVSMKGYLFKGDNGETIEEIEIPSQYQAQAEAKRELMLDALSEFSDEIAELYLEGASIPEELIRKVTREASLALKLTPVFCGSAFKNIGVQKLLDAVSFYLPCPSDIENKAFDLDNNEEQISLSSDPEKAFVGYIFKLEDGKYGQLSYMRVYQGKITKGTVIYNMTMGKKYSVGRLIRMHSNDMEDINSANAGDIVAIFGIDCATGTTFTDGSSRVNLTSMFVPDPVIDLKVELKDRKHASNLSKGFNRFMKEDPTFKVKVDEESSETIISGMGELHLEVYIERLKREYGVELEVGKPQVAYRESITQKAEFNYTHKKQTGGAGQFGRVQGYIEPLEEGEYTFTSKVTGGNIPKEYIGSVDKGFQKSLKEGALIGFPIVGINVFLLDGSHHSVDSSDMAFEAAGRGAFKEVYPQAKPAILEPFMKVDIDTPEEFQGSILGDLNSRRGIIVGTVDEDKFCRISAEVPLAEMFGYVGDLRSMTQGKAEFTMEFSKYSPVPKNLSEELIKKYQNQKKIV